MKGFRAIRKKGPVNTPPIRGCDDRCALHRNIQSPAVRFANSQDTGVGEVFRGPLFQDLLCQLTALDNRFDKIVRHFCRRIERDQQNRGKNTDSNKFHRPIRVQFAVIKQERR